MAARKTATTRKRSTKKAATRRKATAKKKVAAKKVDDRNVYTREKGARIIEMMVDPESPQTLSQILRSGGADMPTSYTVIRCWRQEDPEFARGLEEARKTYCQLREELTQREIDMVCDDAQTVVSRGQAAGIAARVSALRLRMQHDEKYAKVHDRGYYGDKVEVHNAGFVPVMSIGMGPPPPGADPEDVKKYAPEHAGKNVH